MDVQELEKLYMIKQELFLNPLDNASRLLMVIYMINKLEHKK